MDQAETQQQRERGPVGFPPPVVYLAGIAGGVVLELVAPSPNLYPVIRIVGAALGVALFIFFDGGASRLFIKMKTPMPPWQPPTVLVTEGPYQFTRNPMYLGMAFLYAGIALAFSLLWALPLLAVVLLVIDRVVIRREEAYLEQRFGDEYRRYKSEVRRWV